MINYEKVVEAYLVRALERKKLSSLELTSISKVLLKYASTNFILNIKKLPCVTNYV